MHLIFVGEHCINLRHFIRHQQGHGQTDSAGRIIPSGTVRITVLPGDQIDLHGDDATHYLDQMARLRPTANDDPAVVMGSARVTRKTRAPADAPTSSRTPKKGKRRPG